MTKGRKRVLVFATLLLAAGVQARPAAKARTIGSAGGTTHAMLVEVK